VNEEEAKVMKKMEWEEIRAYFENPANHEKLGRIEVLHLEQLNLSYLPPDLKRLQGLVSLDLSRNQFAVLSPDCLPYPKLKGVSLRDNLLEELSEELFWFTPELTTADFTDNLLTKIPSGLFMHTPNLEDVYFSENRLTEVPGTLLVGKRRLGVVELKKNQLKTRPHLPPHKFRDEELMGNPCQGPR
jgi:Leucine-rich repeat (LRR) protein